MKDYIEIIKNNFFSVENIDFIRQILKNKNCSLTGLDGTAESQIIFNACNTIFNQFIQTVYSQKKIINPNTIEELLVTLNKMTIELIINENLKQEINNNYSSNEHFIQQNPIEQVQEVKKEQVQEVKKEQVQKVKKEQVQELKVQKVQEEQVKKCIYIFSEDTVFNDGKYNFEMKDCYKVKLVSFELLNNLYNITENNNAFEITDKNIKKLVNIPIGCYKLNDLIETINDKLTQSNIKMILSTYKNRISINSDSPFSLNFIENENLFIPLRFMLGFNNKEYLNNNNYVSNKDPILNIYDNIYLKIDSTYDNFNIKSSQNFKFYERIVFDQLNTFGQDISSVIKNSNFIDNECNISVELYYRHSSHNKFYKIHKKLQFVLIFDVLIKEDIEPI